jgi:hypothetical protein
VSTAHQQSARAQRGKSLKDGAAMGIRVNQTAPDYFNARACCQCVSVLCL